jgi:nucleotide-binding universal stress UspA family protein
MEMMKAPAIQNRELKTSVKHIIVPLDGSKRAEGVVPYAASIAYMTNSSIELVVVGDKPGGSITDLDSASFESVGEVQSQLSTWLRTVSATVLDGDPADAIKTYAHETGADLIAMATHGRSGLMRKLLGGVARKVMVNTEIPVLAVRADNIAGQVRESRVLDNVIVPLDGSAVAGRAIEIASTIALALKAGMWLVYAQSSDDVESSPVSTALFATQRELEERGLRAEIKTAPGKPLIVIRSFIKQIPRSLVVITSRGVTGGETRARASVADGLIRRSGVPILVVPPARH